MPDPDATLDLTDKTPAESPAAKALETPIDAGDRAAIALERIAVAFERIATVVETLGEGAESLGLAIEEIPRRLGDAIEHWRSGVK